MVERPTLTDTRGVFGCYFHPPSFEEGRGEFNSPAGAVPTLTGDASGRAPEVLHPGNYAERVREGVAFYRDNGITPIHKVRSEYDTRKLYRELDRADLLDEDPLCVFHDMGHPFGWPLDQDPWMPIEMIAGLEGTKERFPDDTVIGVCSGGRNWLPITMEAIARGVDYIRVGIEDYYWMYPHRDEVIQQNIDRVRKVVKMCELLGREIATPEQARDILGVRKT